MSNNLSNRRLLNIDIKVARLPDHVIIVRNMQLAQLWTVRA